jgi:hypothetical protein
MGARVTVVSMGGRPQQQHLYEQGYRSMQFDTPGNKVPLAREIAPRQFKGLVRNVSNSIETASPETIQQGRDWYPRAHDIASHIGRLAGGDVRMGAGLISATSPGTKWEDNLRIAAHVAQHGRGPEGAPMFGESLHKALRIREGEDPVKVLGGMKTGHFIRNIEDPSDPNHVTVDTHAHDAAVGWKQPFKTPRGLGSQGRYDVLAHAHSLAAQRSGLTPPEGQAVSWLNWKQQNTPAGHSRGYDGVMYPSR